VANLNESLTIQIRGDSSGFSRELDQVFSRISELDSRMAGAESSGQKLSSSLQGLRNAITTVDRLSRVFEQLRQHITSVSNTPVRVNVQPAMNALQALQSQIAATRAQLQSLQGMSASAGGFGGAGLVGYAHGGVVNGRPGLDRIPAMLTAGEFVVRESSVNQLGVQFLNALNERGRLPQRTAPRERATEVMERNRGSSSHQTNFGGINIHVRQASDVSGIMRELQAGGVRLKNRRG